MSAYSMIMYAGTIEPRKPGGAEQARSRHQRHGVASMMVLVSVAVVTVMTIAFLHGQDSAPDISDNVVEAVEARYLAESGADILSALMQVESIDWRTAHTNGVLVDRFDVGGGQLSIHVYDLEGNPPTATSEWVVAKCVGAVGSLQQSSVADVHSPKRPRGGADIDLSEFAVFAHQSLNVSNGRITRWYDSPRGRLGKPIHIGTNATAANSINFFGGSRLIDTVACVQQIASNDVVRNVTSFPVKRVNLTQNEAIPVPNCPEPNIMGMKWAMMPVVTVTGFRTDTIVDDRRYMQLKVDNGVIFRTNTAGGRRVALIEDKLEIVNGSAWVLNGELDLIVLGDLVITGSSAINVLAQSRLRLFVGGDIVVDRGGIGFARADVQDVADSQYGVGFYEDPRAVEVYRITSLTCLGNLDLNTGDIITWNDFGSASWEFKDRSFLYGTYYAGKTGDVLLDSNTGLFGRVVGRNVSVDDASSIHYDHVFDDRQGYTNPRTDLYSAPQDLDDVIKGLATSLDDSVLGSILALIGPPPPGSADDGVGPSPRDEDRVAFFKLRQVGLRPSDDKDAVAEKLAPRSVNAVQDE